MSGRIDLTRARRGTAHPEYLRQDVERGWAERAEVFGEGRWGMPVVGLHSPLGFEAVYRAQDIPEDSLSLTLGGARVERTVGSCTGRLFETNRQLTLIAGGSEGGWRARGPIDYAHLHIPRRLKMEWENDFRDRGQRRVLERDDLIFMPDEIGVQCERYARRALDTVDPPGRLEMDSRAHLIGLHLLARYGHGVQGVARPQGGGLSPRRLRLACEMMHAHLEDDLSLGEIAGAVGLSETHFSRAFKQSTGRSPFQWLLDRRVEHAQALLATDASLAEIALASGFSAQPSFTTAFKRATGMTPGEWRRQKRL